MTEACNPRPAETADKAKLVRTAYGRGQRSWDDAKSALLELGFDPVTANKILLGTEHLLGD